MTQPMCSDAPSDMRQPGGRATSTSSQELSGHRKPSGLRTTSALEHCPILHLNTPSDRNTTHAIQRYLHTFLVQKKLYSLLANILKVSDKTVAKTKPSNQRMHHSCCTVKTEFKTEGKLKSG